MQEALLKGMSGAVEAMRRSGRITMTKTGDGIMRYRARFAEREEALAFAHVGPGFFDPGGEWKLKGVFCECNLIRGGALPWHVAIEYWREEVIAARQACRDAERRSERRQDRSSGRYGP